MYHGHKILSVDEKWRLAVPNCYREDLRAQTGGLVLTVSAQDTALWLYPRSVWEEVVRKLAGLSDFERESRRVKRMLQGYATDCTLDPQGRFLIPPSLRKIIALKKQAVLVRTTNKLEIWSLERWQREEEEWQQFVENQQELPASLRELSL